ncbi:GNAT family N-acetyltransferase [Allostreptomyces psammosilenae]|uniref:Ribosomal protein S18 acetylase RimI-like enzyme n=1 Tax=Allostreptomyces psammosilenae TaxID=1892865 RepID=A0A853A1M6_9ACTN|nr:GNAT family N-acetyltransferase [Allostreptomyces psammosilenae]NYI08466.1 ribosomal protein S18 acetylase RimI-like enzyme [Allostreptomyces psammosilenae]
METIHRQPGGPTVAGGGQRVPCATATDQPAAAGPWERRAHTVRPMVEADVEQALHVRHDAWRGAYGGILPPAYLDAVIPDEESLARAVREFRTGHPGRHRLVAELDGRLVGLVVAGVPRPTAPSARLPLPAERIGEVLSLQTVPAVWGSGVGDDLLRTARELMARDGRDVCTLWVLEENTRARHFYRRHGLRPTGDEQVSRMGGRRIRQLRYADAEAVLPAPREESTER